MNATQRLDLEQGIARAHFAVLKVANHAARCGADGTSHDLLLIAEELRRIGKSHLQATKALRGQLSIPTYLYSSVIDDSGPPAS